MKELKINKTKDGLDIQGIDFDKFTKEFEDLEDKGILKPLIHLNQSEQEFKEEFEQMYSQYNKELKKLLRKAYLNTFNPYKTLYELEYLWSKYIYLNVLDEEYINSQRDRMYESMKYPDLEIKKKVMRIKEKVTKKFSNSKT